MVGGCCLYVCHKGHRSDCLHCHLIFKSVYVLITSMRKLGFCGVLRYLIILESDPRSIIYIMPSMPKWKAGYILLVIELAILSGRRSYSIPFQTLFHLLCLITWFVLPRILASIHELFIYDHL